MITPIEKKSLEITPIERLNFKVSDTMRYETLGDYDDETIIVYKGLDEVERLAVGIHEIVEKTILQLQGVSAAEVDKWDTENGPTYDEKMYERDQRYLSAHNFAEVVEMKIIHAAGRDWKEYEKKVMNLPINYINYAPQERNLEESSE